VHVQAGGWPGDSRLGPGRGRHEGRRFADADYPIGSGLRRARRRRRHPAEFDVAVRRRAAVGEVAAGLRARPGADTSVGSYDANEPMPATNMDYVRLGSTGLKVSRICLGTMTYGTSAWRPWVLDEAESRPFLKRALDLGINFFDTADMYSRGMSEEVVGRALKAFARRDQVVIATKAFHPMGDGPNDGGLSRRHLFDAIDASLGRLGVDYVDLYQIHRFDAETPIDETLEALHDIVKAGKARYIGASSMYAWQFAKMLYVADAHGWTRFVSMQNHYNLVYREEEREMLPLCREEGIGVIPWSPLARGFLAGNRRKQDLGDTTRAKTDDFASQLY